MSWFNVDRIEVTIDPTSVPFLGKMFRVHMSDEGGIPHSISISFAFTDRDTRVVELTAVEEHGTHTRCIPHGKNIFEVPGAKQVTKFLVKVDSHTWTLKRVRICARIPDENGGRIRILNWFGRCMNIPGWTILPRLRFPNSWWYGLFRSKA